MRPPLVDLLLEAQSLVPPSAPHIANVEAYRMQPPPLPAGAADLSCPERLRILNETVQWTRRESKGYATLGIGPAYLLSHSIERSIPEACDLRGPAAYIHERLVRFATAPL